MRSETWEMGHLTVYGADVGESGSSQGGYKACGRLGNPVRVMGYPRKQRDTQRVRTLGRRLGAQPGDWGAERVVEVMGHPWELWDTQERGEGTGEGRDTPGGYGTPRRLGKPRDS